MSASKQQLTLICTVPIDFSDVGVLSGLAVSLSANGVVLLLGVSLGVYNYCTVSLFFEQAYL